MTNDRLFNVRVYGILVVNDALLVSDENHHGQHITKFPGGGLQFGEGTIECLKREFREELDLEIENIHHFYTVDFFQLSAFNKRQQVIGVYYLVNSKDAHTIKFSQDRFNFQNQDHGQQVFRWIKLEDISPEEFTFPIDQHVAELLSEAFRVQKK